MQRARRELFQVLKKILWSMVLQVREFLLTLTVKELQAQAVQQEVPQVVPRGVQHQVVPAA